MNKIYKIYKCTNNINGKSYIGFTNKTLSKRIIEHKCHNLDPENRKIFSEAIKLSWQKRKQKILGAQN